MAPARDGLGAWLTDSGVPETAMWEILTAAGEACANALEHSGTDVTAACPAWIEAWTQGGEVHLVVGDHGRWREPEPAGIAGRGRGRMLMAALMDTMSIRTGPEGTVVEMTKSLAHLTGPGTPGAEAHSAVLRPVHAPAG